MGVKFLKKLVMNTQFSNSEAVTKNLTLCFNKDDFMNESFSVDKFVSEHRKYASLEKLRDDLTTYLKVLKSSMVELINQDYADFVNLSTNLAGLDKSINNLCIPLGQLREEVLLVKSSLDEALETAYHHVQRQKELRDKKLTLQRISTVLNGVQKLEKMSQLSPFTSDELYQDKSTEPVESVIERIANELIDVQVHLNEIPSLPLTEELKPKVWKISNSLQTYLNEAFLIALNKNARMKLEFVLRINSSLGKSKEIEKLFLNKILQPYLENIITENNLKMGIEKMYKELLSFVPLKCKHLIDLTTTPTGLTEAIIGYDFLVEVIFPEMILNLESRVPVIFSPGNPQQFHQYYLASEEFIADFENLCPNQEIKDKLKSSRIYIGFKNKWNLPVYFQIQFPKIAGTFENSLSKDYQLSKEGSDYKLIITQVLMNCVEKCWSRDIFLPKLSHRFWKLTLQLLNRFCLWAKEATSNEITINSSNNQQNFEETTTSNGPSYLEKKFDVAHLVMLVQDIETLQLKVPLYFKEVICPILMTRGFTNTDILKGGLEESILKLNDLLNTLAKLITKQIANHCALNLKQVPDIPRLYRKTNKEVPTKPSNYVNIIFNPLENFLSTHQGYLSRDTYQLWSGQVVDRLTEQYLTVTRDVLHSVKRVEDSMKILRKARERTPTNINSQVAVSDDDKIRIQLLIDIEAYGLKIDNLGLKSLSFSSYAQLKELAESTRNSLSSNS